MCLGNSDTRQEGGSYCYMDIWAVLEGSTPPIDSPGLALWALLLGNAPRQVSVH